MYRALPITTAVSVAPEGSVMALRGDHDCELAIGFDSSARADLSELVPGRSCAYMRDHAASEALMGLPARRSAEWNCAACEIAGRSSRCECASWRLQLDRPIVVLLAVGTRAVKAV
jgi:hypothetical protein